MISRVRYWSDIISRIALPLLVALVSLMWQSSESHASDQEARMRGIEKQQQDTQLIVTTLATELRTGVSMRLDGDEKRVGAIESHQDKQDDRINELEIRR